MEPGRTVYQLKHGLLDDYLMQQLKNPSLKWFFSLSPKDMMAGHACVASLANGRWNREGGLYAKTTMIIALLLPLVVLPPRPISAQSATELSVCEYQERRNPVPINPKTNKAYTPDERNQEPFTEASITKEAIRQCLQAKKPIENHHIVFEDYRDAWQEMAKETGDYAIPLLIKGGVLHANQPYDAEKKTGGIRLWEFRDQTIKDASSLQGGTAEGFWN